MSNKKHNFKKIAVESFLDGMLYAVIFAAAIFGIGVFFIPKIAAITAACIGGGIFFASGIRQNGTLEFAVAGLFQQLTEKVLPPGYYWWWPAPIGSVEAIKSFDAITVKEPLVIEGIDTKKGDLISQKWVYKAAVSCPVAAATFTTEGLNDLFKNEISGDIRAAYKLFVSDAHNDDDIDESDIVISDRRAHIERWLMGQPSGCALLEARAKAKAVAKAAERGFDIESVTLEDIGIDPEITKAATAAEVEKKQALQEERDQNQLRRMAKQLQEDSREIKGYDKDGKPVLGTPTISWEVCLDIANQNRGKKTLRQRIEVSGGSGLEGAAAILAGSKKDKS